MAQIIASVFATSREQVAHSARNAAMAGADWLELRLDRWPAGHDLGAAIGSSRLPVLVACRTPEDGGHFRGTLGERRELLSAALDGGAEGIDLDAADPWSPPAGRTRLRLRIRSFHSFTGVPRELPAIHARLHATAGSVAKLVVTAHDLADAAPVLELLTHCDQRRQPTVAFAMGRTAWPVRVIAAMLGAPFVYGCLEPGQETAPGQVPVAWLRQLYRVHDLGPDTQLFGVLGNPALSSLGPWLHNRVFRRLGFDGVYLPFETSRPEATLAMLLPCRLRGLSVTAPYKAVIAAACHQLAQDAAATSVVNTVVVEPHGHLAGHNTDVEGVTTALAGAGVGNGAGRVGVVLGTGGAARAGALALQRLGFAVTMLGRSLDAVRDFARSAAVQLGSLSTALLQELQPAVLLQATPVGSLGRDPEERLLPDHQVPEGCVVLDMVYQPPWTRFLRDAQAAGGVAVPGAAMFLGQARAQVRHFTGHTVDAPLLRSCLAGTAAAVVDGKLAGGR